MISNKCILCILLILLVGFSCKKEEAVDLSCKVDDIEIFIRSWRSPIFISNSTNCYLGECLEMTFDINADSSYQLYYKVYESTSDSIIRERNDTGKYEFNCLERGQLGGRYSFHSYVEGEIILRSDSLSLLEWDLHWNGLEGLVLQPENFGFTHGAYVTL